MKAKSRCASRSGAWPSSSRHRTVFASANSTSLTWQCQVLRGGLGTHSEKQELRGNEASSWKYTSLPGVQIRYNHMGPLKNPLCFQGVSLVPRLAHGESFALSGRFSSPHLTVEQRRGEQDSHRLRIFEFAQIFSICQFLASMSSTSKCTIMYSDLRSHRTSEGLVLSNHILLRILF